MIIKTKFNPGDTFFALDNGKIKEHTVDFLSVMSASVKAEDKTNSVSYYPVDIPSYGSTPFKEGQMFASKSKLLKDIQS